MKIFLLGLFVFLFPVLCFGQTMLADLKPAHAAVLEDFLSKNKEYQFLSSKVISADYMKFVRESLGKNAKPYYLAADFNQDKFEDFAIILSRKGARKASGATSQEHKYDYPLAVVIFNGSKNGTYTRAFIEKLEAPHVCFLKVEGTRKKTLYFGVFETDNSRIFAPTRNSYVVKAPNYR